MKVESLPPDIPAEALAYLKDIGYLDDERLHVGSQAPRIVLSQLNRAETAVIGDSRALVPTVLIFGSYT